jgi:uncharacterized protein (TIGR03435 family)
MRIVAAILPLLFSGGAAWGQPADTLPSFEVASIKLSPPPSGQVTRIGCPSDPGRIVCTNVTVGSLVTRAYGLSRLEFENTPALNEERYEVAVKLPAGASGEQIRLMWQKLLAERFKLKAHRETRQVQGYNLSVAKGGPKILEGAEPSPPVNAPPPSMSPNAPVPEPPRLGADGFPEVGSRTGVVGIGNKARWGARAVTMEQVASTLSLQLGQPVRDSTGLTGKYAFTLSWVTEPSNSQATPSSGQPGGDASVIQASDPEGPDLIEAVQRQLGLRLEPMKVPVQVLIVDHVEKPTEN